jgi:hypothetical protein
MDGLYDFDADGIAQAISAPQWSVDALLEIQGDVQKLERLLANDSISDEVKDQWTDRTVGKLSERDVAFAQAVADAVLARTGPERTSLFSRLGDFFGRALSLKEAGKLTYIAAKELLKMVGLIP